MTTAILRCDFKTPVGEMVLGSYHGQLCLADWRYRRQRDMIDKRLQRYLKAEFESINHVEQDPIIALAAQQLEQYFAGERRQFDLPLRLVGSEFQQAVWQALMGIDYGETASYSKLANALSKPKAVRAVASANGANAISIIVPCHRIIGADGSLVGYAGGLRAKQSLLALEQGVGFEKTASAPSQTPDLFA